MLAAKLRVREEKERDQKRAKKKRKKKPTHHYIRFVFILLHSSSVSVRIFKNLPYFRFCCRFFEHPTTHKLIHIATHARTVSCEYIKSSLIRARIHATTVDVMYTDSLSLSVLLCASHVYIANIQQHIFSVNKTAHSVRMCIKVR